MNHDSYGPGTVIGVEDDVAVLIDFGTGRKRILTPCDKLFKLRDLPQCTLAARLRRLCPVRRAVYARHSQAEIREEI
ncbi:hypothetical protein Rhe02_32800 [Rhizocola hellebori]|uniref:Uncharacterized protein n=1 Tax=Rhizocola hellebori TaxID=1392758 RepID=A0A8J3Q8K2_9ACTN|nr:hypothetical protein Rhe02_32800 [Rhizocola hellebori]